MVDITCFVAILTPAMRGTFADASCPGGGIGRRAGFRCQWPQGRGSSSLLLGTIFYYYTHKSQFNTMLYRHCLVVGALAICSYETAVKSNINAREAQPPNSLFAHTWLLNVTQWHCKSLSVSVCSEAYREDQTFRAGMSIVKKLILIHSR